MPVTLPETIVRRRCAALIPYARNARTHSDQQVAEIAASIREFGFTNPVLIDEEDGIIAGHGRVLAAHLLGLDEVPCIAGFSRGRCAGADIGRPRGSRQFRGWLTQTAADIQGCQMIQFARLRAAPLDVVPSPMAV